VILAFDPDFVRKAAAFAEAVVEIEARFGYRG
jgi:hypothetical protein